MHRRPLDPELQRASNDIGNQPQDFKTFEHFYRLRLGNGKAPGYLCSVLRYITEVFAFPLEPIRDTRKVVVDQLSPPGMTDLTACYSFSK